MTVKIAEAYPLYWPEGWPRTARPRPAAFKIGKEAFARVRDSVMSNVRPMGGRSAVLSTNVPLRLDGLPYAGIAEPRDSGVAVYWYDEHVQQQRCMACDKWDRVVHNLRAVELSLEALRGLARWGSTEIVERAFRGFSALPPSGADWRAVLGFWGKANPSLDEVKLRYRERAREAHPDHGGNPHEMQRLNAAMAAAELELGA